MYNIKLMSSLLALSASRTINLNWSVNSRTYLLITEMGLSMFKPICPFIHTVQITFIFIDFRVCDFAFGLKRKAHTAFRVLNAFYFQTDFNLRFKRKRDVRLTCKRVWCILHRTLSIQWLCPVTSHIIAQMDLTSGFGNISFELN